MKYIFLLILVVIVAFSCSSELNDATADTTGTVSGSYANMLTIGNFLYVISDTDITTLDITNGAEAVEINRQDLGFGIESLFHRNGVLFIGSKEHLHIYEIQANGVPTQKSITEYNPDFWGAACIVDPIVVNDSIAYVTLSDAPTTICLNRQNVNELKLYDINNIEQPKEINSVFMTNPKGLGLDGEWLFVCDDGLKVFNVQDPLNLEMKYHFDGFASYDVIPLDGLLMVVGPDNLYQFDYTDIEQMALLSTIDL